MLRQNKMNENSNFECTWSVRTDRSRRIVNDTPWYFFEIVVTAENGLFEVAPSRGTAVFLHERSSSNSRVRSLPPRRSRSSIAGRPFLAKPQDRQCVQGRKRRSEKQSECYSARFDMLKSCWTYLGNYARVMLKLSRDFTNYDLLLCK